MSNAVFSNSYKLKKGASIPDFTLAYEDLVSGEISKIKGYVSSTLLVDGDTWADNVVFETTDDLHAFLAAAEAAQVNGPSELAAKFYSFLNFNTCRTNVFSVQKSFGGDKN